MRTEPNRFVGIRTNDGATPWRFWIGPLLIARTPHGVHGNLHSVHITLT